MSNHTTCERGHFYPAAMDKCPFCEKEDGNPVPKSNSDDAKTMKVPNTPTSGDDSTVRLTNDQANETRSSVKPNVGGATISAAMAGGAADDDRTMIHRPTAKEGSEPQAPVDRRRLEGWLVSYTIDPAGIDFRLFEGKNLIGRDAESDIRILQDPKVSGHHAVIFIRNNKAVFQDELSSNASYVNDAEVDPGDRVKLTDGDEIQIGDQKLYFRKIKPD